MDFEEEDEKISMLLAMGFPDIEAITKALKSSKGDINEAVSMLTENPLGFYDTCEDLSKLSEENFTNATVFPSGPARSLYDRVHAIPWSIPFQRNETLGQCLLASTSLAKKGLCDLDADCQRFFNELLPECFFKLLNANVVRNWDSDVQEGVFDMLLLLIELAVAVLQNCDVKPNPGVMRCCSEAFSHCTEFHITNKYRESKYSAFTNYAELPEDELKYGWLLDLINKFGDAGGFDALFVRLNNSALPIGDVANLLRPFSMGSKFLSRALIWPQLKPIIENVLKRLAAPHDADLKTSDAERCFQLVEQCKMVCAVFWPDQLERLAGLHLHLIHTMIKLPHFTARINALKGLSKLIADTEKIFKASSSNVLDIDYVQNWITEKKILYYALNGSLDQIQYTEHMRELMDTLAPKLRLEDLSRMWELVDHASSPQVIENIHDMLEVAAKRFSPLQFEHVLKLVCKSFDRGSALMQEKLLNFLGNIGRDNRLGRTAESMLDVVWELSRRTELPGPLVDMAMQQHLCILSHASNKESLRRKFMKLCIEDISRSPAVYLPLKHLLVLAQSLTSPKGVYVKSEKLQLTELCRQQQLIPLVTHSLVQCHQLGVQNRGGRAPLLNTLIDGKYTHQEYMTVHIELLKLLLKEGELYLPSRCAKQIWDTLVTNPSASKHDQETCFELLMHCLPDLETSSRREVLTDRLLHLPPASLTPPAYSCLLAYWRAVNEHDRRLVRSSNDKLVVESHELTGHDYFWRMLLEGTHLEIVHQAANLLIVLAFTGLAPKLKRNPAALHQRFIKECHRRLDRVVRQLQEVSETTDSGIASSTSSECGSGPPTTDSNIITGSTGMAGAISTVLSAVTNSLSAAEETEDPLCVDIPLSHNPRELLQQVERLTSLCKEYISRVESEFGAPRSILPHAATFHGSPLQFIFSCNKFNSHRIIHSHSHESIRSLCIQVLSILQQHSSSNNTQKISFEHINQLTFIRRKNNNVDNNDTGQFFSIKQSKTNPLDYKYRSDVVQSAQELLLPDQCKEHRRTIPSNSWDGLDEKPVCEDQFTRLVVTMSERDQQLLCELGVEESCELRVTLTAAANTKEVSWADSWNELPYSPVGSAESSSALVPYVPAPTAVEADVSSCSSNNNSDAVVPDSSTPAKACSKSSGKSGLFERMQGATMRSIAAAGVEDDSNPLAKLDDEKNLPGLLVADRAAELFDMLFKLGQLHDCRVQEGASRLLRVIPTQGELLHKLDTMCNVRSASDRFSNLRDDGNNSMCSPAKREKLRDKDAVSPQLTLRQLLDPGLPGMSPFRLLYHLEAMCSKVVWLGEGCVDDSLNADFCKELLRWGGFRLLWGLLDEVGAVAAENLPDSAVSGLLHRKIQYRVLLILKYLICGTGSKSGLATVPGDPYTASGCPPPCPLKPYTKATPGSTSSPSHMCTRVFGPVCCGPARPELLRLTDSDWLLFVLALMKSVWAPAACRLSCSAAAGTSPPHTAAGSLAAAAEAAVLVRSQMDAVVATANQRTEAGAASCGFLSDCSNNVEISMLETNITSTALNILVAVLAVRSNQLDNWYSIDGLRPYLLELVLSCSSSEVRVAACRALMYLTRLKTCVQPHPRLFILQMLVKAPLPLWVSTSHARGAALKTIAQSLEYFKLRSYLLCHLDCETEQYLGVSTEQMLEDEVNWLTNFTLTRPRSRHRPESTGLAVRRAADDTLCAGHLTLVQSLLTAPNLALYEVGNRLVPLLLDVYLFPAATMLLDDRNTPSLETAAKAYCGKCCGLLSREHAYAVLLQLASSEPRCLSSLSRCLTRLHHLPPPQPLHHWQVSPPLAHRASCGFVGLRNGGATCYMNSVLQQLFLVPGIREDLLSVSLPCSTHDGLLYQLQTVFGHLLESELAYYEPCKFWESFRMDGRPVNIREQQDAFEFYTRLVEQIDDFLKVKGIERVFAKRFQGVFSIQRICQDCPHRFEREESFLSLNLTVKMMDCLTSSLEQLVKGEVLEGDNAYYCETCKSKGRAIMRTCIKQPPQVLVIQLKRFGYDYDNGRSVKYDDHYSFPWSLDLAPFTSEYLAELEALSSKKNSFLQHRSRSPSPITRDDLVMDMRSKSPVTMVPERSTTARGRGSAKAAGYPRSAAAVPGSSRSGVAVRRSARHKRSSSSIADIPLKEESSSAPLEMELSDCQAMKSKCYFKVGNENDNDDEGSDSDVFGTNNSVASNEKATKRKNLSRKISDPTSVTSKEALAENWQQTPPSTPDGKLLDEIAVFATPTDSPSMKRGRQKSGSRKHVYELVGVVVHVGQAAAGHYYSYIKDRRGDTLTNPNKGKWFKFNDTNVEEVEMTDKVLEHECFGGTFKASSSNCSGDKALPEERRRYWSGYLLFYERVDGRTYSRTPATAPRHRPHTRSVRLPATHSVRRNLNLSSGSPCVEQSCSSSLLSSGDSTASPAESVLEPLSPATSQSLATGGCGEISRQVRQLTLQSSLGDRGRDRLARSSLSELRDLMDESEKRGMFSQQRLPPQIAASIVHFNLELYRNRCLYHRQYYDFLLALCSRAADISCLPSVQHTQAESVELSTFHSREIAEAQAQAARLALSFLFNTYLRLQTTSEDMVKEWSCTIQRLVEGSSSACAAALAYFRCDDTIQHLQSLLLHAPERSLRNVCRRMLGAVLLQAVSFATEHPPVLKELMVVLLSLKDLLINAVPSCIATSQAFFSLLHDFTSKRGKHCHYFLRAGGFCAIMQFLLGRDVTAVSDHASDSDNTSPGANSSTRNSPDTKAGARRITSVQLQELGLLHAVSAHLILSCDLTSLATHTDKCSTADTDAFMEDSIDINEDSIMSIDVEMTSSALEEVELKKCAKLTDNTSPCIPDLIRIDNFCYEEKKSKGSVASCDEATSDGKSGVSVSAVAETEYNPPPPASMCAVLLGGKATADWLAIVVAAYTSQVEHTTLLTPALQAACHNNLTFTKELLATLLSHYNTAASNALRELTQLMQDCLAVQDMLLTERVSFIISGCTDYNGILQLGLLDLITEHYRSDVRRAYQSMKLCVLFANRHTEAREALVSSGEKWRAAVNWLTDLLQRSYEGAASSWETAPLSNEGNHSNVFQRTTSAQMTLEEATTLLDQIGPLDMETESANNDELVDIREDSPSLF